MEIVYWPIHLLRLVFSVFPVELAITPGLVLFGLSWIRPKRIVSLPSSGRRATTLTAVGIAGSLLVLLAATVVNWIAFSDALIRSGSWWQRPVPLVAATLVVIAAAVVLRREPLPAPGERAISPRRRWWAFAPQPPLWIATGVATLLLCTAAWQMLIAVPLPEGADRYGVGPETNGLPEFMQLQQGMGYVWGAGWPNHLASLLAVIAAAIALILALGSDANRPLFARASAAGVHEERAATARMLVFVILGGLLLVLGAVWAHVGFIGEAMVGVDDDPVQGRIEVIVGTGYRDIAPLMHLGGYVVQGIGAALLLRLVVDSLRALRARRTGDDWGSGSGPASGADSEQTSADAGAIR